MTTPINAIGWAETELSAAKDRLESAQRDVAFCEARLAQMNLPKDETPNTKDSSHG